MLFLGLDTERLQEVYDQIHGVYPMKSLEQVLAYLGIHSSLNATEHVSGSPRKKHSEGSLSGGSSDK
ncbi:hypothetical protein CFIMG_007844RA00001 [Ceratocystis fimbriata CBS 114723]|uniref:Uncharacterized protein n=1 Tax=Ceratocystis fimbriata CBS 114723 TaxID=1035309 RepID=A0A2C5WU69_9PEZI|nr:hypothetical protein CFIMG_007844RA00001 [Ceratocystis fimbriata CBS 114723]